MITSFGIAEYDDQKRDLRYYDEVVHFLNIDKVHYLAIRANFLALMSYQLPQQREEIIKVLEMDLYKYVTPSIHKFDSPFSLVRGFPRWFIVSYPDVLFWFKNLPDKDIHKIIEIKNEEEILKLLDNEKINLPTLRKIVNAYKKNSKLESSI